MLFTMEKFSLICFLVIVTLITGAPGEAEHEKHKPVPHHEHYPGGEHDTAYDHDSILGSHKAEEEFSHLTPEESKLRLRELLLRMDENGDGKISRPELESWVLKSFRQLDQEEAEERFKEYDVVGDQKLDWPEYLQKVYGMTEQEVKDMVKSEETEAFLEMTEDDTAKFNAADVNKDGFLDAIEFVAFEYPYDFPNMYDVEIDRTLKDVDKDRDGQISFPEFYGNADIEEEEKISQRVDFDEYDKNKDGFLDRAEALPWVLPDNESAAREEAEHLISQTDMDQDGVLTPDEIVEHHDLWVGSQATNYGRHLQDEL